MAGKVTRTEANLEDDKNFDTIYKLLIIGDSNVGKTTLLTRFCEGRYQSNFMSTVGIDYKTKIITVDDERVKLQIWDTAGQERFRTLTNAYFRGAAGALLLYDITSRSSFVNCTTWMESVSQHASPNICVVIVGHKCDAEEDRVVTTSEGLNLAEHYEALFFEASSKASHNVSKVFIRLAHQVKQTQETATYHKIGTSNLTKDRKLTLKSNELNSNCAC